MKISLQKDKMKELILYISEKSGNDAGFGATKLNKALFFSDFLAYRNTGNSITGKDYQKLPKGPAPKCLLPLRQEMIDCGDLKLEPSLYYGNTQHRAIPLRKADMDIFSAEEIAIVDSVLCAMEHMNATQCSDWSHKFIGWDLAELKETIPYEVALVGTADDLSSEEIEYAESLTGLAEECVTATR